MHVVMRSKYLTMQQLYKEHQQRILKSLTRHFKVCHILDVMSISVSIEITRTRNGVNGQQMTMDGQTPSGGCLQYIFTFSKLLVSTVKC